MVKQEYNLMFNSCTTIVQYSLIKSGVFNSEKLYMIPNKAYEVMKRTNYKAAF